MPEVRCTPESFAANGLSCEQGHLLGHGGLPEPACSLSRTRSITGRVLAAIKRFTAEHTGIAEMNRQIWLGSVCSLRSLSGEVLLGLALLTQWRLDGPLGSVC